jgi:hypothetical protein
MHYVGDSKFALAFHRHTGEWIQIHNAISIDESIQEIQVNPWFMP